jgi:Zn-dependent membrane protease YugP
LGNKPDGEHYDANSKVIDRSKQTYGFSAIASKSAASERPLSRQALNKLGL